MNILTKNDIATAIDKCSPHLIAVAYIGIDWEKYIKDHEKIEKIILSPTLGSNPYAITNLVDKVGWDKVEFLDELHAKIYIGNDFTIIGSANLTKNGLSGCNLIELCYKIDNENDLNEVKNTFNEILTSAKNKYPENDKKMSKLSELYEKWGSAATGDIIKNESTKAKFSDFELLTNDHFYISWYNEYGTTYSPEAEKIKSEIDDESHFLPDDNIKKDKWVLSWRLTNKMVPDKKTKPNWVYIHEIISNGIIENDYEYTTLAFQKENTTVPEPPFELTADVISAFKDAICTEQLSPYFIQKDHKLYKLSKAQEKLPELIKQMKININNK